MCLADKDSFISLEGRIDEDSFIESEFANVFIQDGLSIDTPIYRYTSLLTLLQILSGKFFVSLKKNFCDKHEKGETFMTTCYDFCVAGESLTGEQLEKGQILKSNIKETKFFPTSCWTKKEKEDYLMWKAYASEVLSVRISSTIRCLLESIETTGYKVYIGEMRYKNLLRVPISNITNRLFEKSEYYEGEQEIRFYFLPIKPVSMNAGPLFLKVTNPLLLLQEITLSPFLPVKSRGLLKEYLTKTHHYLEDRIMVSRIYE